MKTIYERAKAAGLEIDSHESDLYLKDTLKAREIVREWESESKRRVSFITYFHSEIDNAQWMDIPFAFDPFWSEKGEQSAIMAAA